MEYIAFLYNYIQLQTKVFLSFLYDKMSIKYYLTYDTRSTYDSLDRCA